MTKKIIIIMYDFFSEHGGVERIMEFQAKTLKKAGYEVIFAFAYVDSELKETRLSEFEVIEYSPLPIKNETLQISSSILRNNNIDKFKEADLIICHSFPASYFASRIKKAYGIPYLLHLHHPPQFLYGANLDWAKNSFKRQFSFLIGKIIKKPLQKFDFYCVKNANNYFVECKSVQRVIKRTYGLEGYITYPTFNPIFKIHNFSLKDLKKYGIDKKFVLGSGRIIGQKRFDFLVKAMAKLDNAPQLVLVGKYDENIKKKLVALANKLKVKLLFLGPVDIKELVKIYNLASLTVLTCPKEWFGLVPIEAMACGCPVVGWRDNFGPEETIVEGKSGFLSKPYLIKDLAEKINKTLETNWSKKDVRKTIEKFSEEKIRKELIKEIKKIL